MLACLEAEREAAEAAAREQGRAYLEALTAGTAAAGQPPAAVALAAQQLQLETAIAAEETTLADWQARHAAGTGKKARKTRARLEALQAQAAAETGQAPDVGNEKKAAKASQRNVTDPDSRLLPVRGGGFIQGYNCQDTGDVLQAQALAAVAEKGAAVVAAAHAADPAMLAKCHGRLAPCPSGATTIPVTTSPPAMPP